MSEKVRTDSVTVLGHLPDDHDTIPYAPPSGFIWMVSSSLGGNFETYEIADVRVALSGEALDFSMTLADAILLRDLLDRTISTMEDGVSDYEAFEV